MAVDDAATLSFSALPFLARDLEPAMLDGSLSKHHVTAPGQRQTHAAELRPRNMTVLNIDHRHMGLGGVHSWGALPHPAHMVWADRAYQFGVTLRPFDRRDPPPDVLARRLALDAAADRVS